MTQNLSEMVIEAMKSLFTTMLGMSITATGPEPPLDQAQMHIISSVGFGGQLTGVAYFQTTLEAARRMTARLLQADDPETVGDESVNDALGELANMLVGQIKSQLSDRGIECRLTVPSVVRGQQLRVRASGSVEANAIGFNTESDRVIVTVLLRRG